MRCDINNLDRYKQWSQRKKTDKGWTEESVVGYYAGMVRVPQKYREKLEEKPTQ